MFTVICSLLIMISVTENGKHLFYIQSRANLTGTVKAADGPNYLVDFSKDAEAKGVAGDYSQILTKADQCVRL